MEVRLLVEQSYNVCDRSTPLASVKDRLLRDGFVVVMDSDRFLGIVTPADVLRSAGSSVAECLRDGPHVAEDQELAEVLRRMEEAGVCVLPVFRGDAFVGVVRQRRVAISLLERHNRLEQDLEREAALAPHKSRIRYRTLFETMAQGVVYQDADGRITSANPAAERILGLTLDQMAGRVSRDPRWHAIRPDGSEFPGHEHPAMVALRTGEPVRDVLMGVFNPRLEDCVWININAIPQFRAGRTAPFEVYTTFEDVTESRRVEAALRESETRFRELAELLPQTVFELNSEGFFTFANRCALETFGYGQEEIGSLHICQVFAPEDRDRIVANIRKRLIAESFDDHEYLALKKDGSTFPVLIYSSAIVRDGRAVGVRGIVIDISSRKEWEQALCTSERRYRMLIETSLDGICVFDLLGRLVEVNESYCRISGYSRDELLQMTINDLDAVETPEQTRLRIRRIQRSGEDRFESKHRRKDGSLIDVEMAVRVLDPGEYRLVAYVRDVTEHKRIEARIKEREATLLHAARLSTLGEMTSGIAHELNQPLSAILSYGDACLHLAQAQPPDLPRIVRNLGEIVSQGERAGLIIRRMRALARGQQPRFVSTDLGDAIRNAVALTRWEVAQNGMQLNLEAAESLPPVYADAIQIEQVLLNLIRNAIDAMCRNEEEPQVLTLRTMVRDAHVYVEVCDTGVGLPQTDEDRIFEPFFTTKLDGLGMGLSISRSIIEAHKGLLGARPNVDRGAVFFFTLPVQHVAGP